MNNAGVMACPLQYTADGFEYQLGVSMSTLNSAEVMQLKD